MRRPQCGVRRTIINGLKSIYQIPSLLSIPSGLYGGKPALKEDLSWISGHFYQGGTKVYNTYWINPLQPIKGPSPTVNSGVLQISGHRYQRTTVSVSDDPSQPCSMKEQPQRRRTVLWPEDSSCLDQRDFSFSHLINKEHCFHPRKN